MKKLISLILIILVAVILGGALWYVFFASEEVRERAGQYLPFGASPSESSRFDSGGENGFGGAPEDGGLLPGDFEGGGRLPVLYQLHKEPVAGIGVFARAGKTRARYVERGLGHIYETTLDDLEEKQVSGETINGIYRARWGAGGRAVAIQQLDEDSTIVTYALELPAGATSTNTFSLEGTYLPENIVSLAERGHESDRLFYVREINDAVVGIASDFDGTHANQLWSSPFTEWIADWAAPNTIALTTKASAGVAGYLYFLDTETGGVSRVLEDIPGLTALVSPDARYVAYSWADSGNTFAMLLRDLETGDDKQISLAALPEKCVWSNRESGTLYCAVPIELPRNALYPDDWYQGTVSFADDLWRIDAANGNTERVAQLVGADGVGIDAVDPLLGPDERMLFFINKKDGTPWRVLLERENISGDQSTSAVGS